MKFARCLLFSLLLSVSSFANPKFCAAVQGNGDAIFAHFHSLARIISYYGMVDAIAGSSSATITSFLLESMLDNPAIKDCRCSDEEKAQRISLMLKSFVGFYESSQGRKEAEAIYTFVQNVKALKEHRFDARQDTQRLEEEDFRHLAAVLGALYNPRFEAIFKESPDRKFHFNDYRQALGLGAFKVDNTRVFLRPYPARFEGIATIVGWIGNFYASRNYDNRGHWESFFEACQPDTLKEKSWGEIAYHNYDRSEILAFVTGKKRQPTRCQEKFDVLLSDYRAMSKEPQTNDRVDEAVGKYLTAFPITGIVVGPGVQKIERAKKAYWNATDKIELGLDYDKEYRVGYFGKAEQLAAMEKKVTGSPNLDVKTKKFFPLPGFKWRDVFHTSPAEPSISEAMVLVKDKIVSVGGWADPFPSTVLKLAGCENTFFIASERESFQLVDDVNRLLGGGHVKYVDGALAQGIKDTDAVWCTDWNDPKYREYMALENIYQLTENTFRLHLETNKPFFKHISAPMTKRRYGCN